MGREIIGDDMNFLCRGLASNDLLEKSHELRAGMADRGSAEDFTTLGVERRKERKRPVPIARLLGLINVAINTIKTIKRHWMYWTAA